jgi:hypothetical protein
MYVAPEEFKDGFVSLIFIPLDKKSKALSFRYSASALTWF